jgi:hypothetical protein
MQYNIYACSAGLRRKGAVVADHELERIMSQVDLDGNHTLDFQVRAAKGGLHCTVEPSSCSVARCLAQHIKCLTALTCHQLPSQLLSLPGGVAAVAGVPDRHGVPGQAAAP